MKPLRGTIKPAPKMIGAQSLQDIILYGADATYEPGTLYDITIDMIPDYVFQGAQSGRFCLHNQKFNDPPAWSALIASTEAVSYSISIADTKTVATIPAFFPQSTFYEAFRAFGAFDCGPVPNIRF